jgi:hypothetical protein
MGNTTAKGLERAGIYIPRERRDLTGAIIVKKANWTNEGIIIWLDNREK